MLSACTVGLDQVGSWLGIEVSSLGSKNGGADGITLGKNGQRGSGELKTEP